MIADEVLEEIRKYPAAIKGDKQQFTDWANAVCRRRQGAVWEEAVVAPVAAGSWVKVTIHDYLFADGSCLGIPGVENVEGDADED
ncbi:MAG: hypothetical protein J6333_00305 [Planctomycetes bacterium]|nr:hypothetical protein [Planctomycetota bacterium]